MIALLLLMAMLGRSGDSVDMGVQHQIAYLPQGYIQQAGNEVLAHNLRPTMPGAFERGGYVYYPAVISADHATGTVRYASIPVTWQSQTAQHHGFLVLPQSPGAAPVLVEQSSPTGIGTPPRPAADVQLAYHAPAASAASDQGRPRLIYGTQVYHLAD